MSKWQIQKKSEKFKQAASNLALDPEQENLTSDPRHQPETSDWDPEQYDGMTEEEAFKEYGGEIVMDRGKKIASQSWRSGSWSSVYEYKGKFYSFDEVENLEFDNPKEAFERANIGRDDWDEIWSQKIDPEYTHLV